MPPDVAREVADRLMADDLFSGWGIRTLSTAHPSYNPFAYHLGAVWPVENATIALGFKRYGLDDHADQLLDGMFAAIAYCRDLRLPEALTGHDRSDLPTPLPYPSSQSPQAWSASATVQLLQVMLGLYPFAPAGVLGLVRPRLPVWLPTVTLHGLRVGHAVATIDSTATPTGPRATRSLSRREPCMCWASRHPTRSPARTGSCRASSAGSWTTRRDARRRPCGSRLVTAVR